MSENGYKWNKMVKNGEKLIGQYKVKVTNKGRIAFPKKLREVVGNQVIITRGYDNSLMAVPVKEWNKLMSDIENGHFFKEATRDTTRFILGNAAKIDLVIQGRFIMPMHLKEYAQISREAIFLGLGKYIEIWDKKKWDSYQSYLGKNIKEISQKIENARE